MRKEPRLSEWHGGGKCFVLRSRARGQDCIAVKELTADRKIHISDACGEMCH